MLTERISSRQASDTLVCIHMCYRLLENSHFKKKKSVIVLVYRVAQELQFAVFNCFKHSKWLKLKKMLNEVSFERVYVI